MAIFTFNSVSLDGNVIFPATYKIDDNNVIIEMKTPDGKSTAVSLGANHPLYHDAMTAAQAAADAKKARGPVPEKDFIGTEIKGPDWRIVFGSERTRIIFKGVPPVAYRDAVKNAGFHYSPKDKTWNKKATFKAYRAAVALHDELWRIRERKAAIPA